MKARDADDPTFHVTDGPETWEASLIEMEAANSADEYVCDWLRDALVGAVLDDGHGLRIKRIR